jgi:dipeptidyl aminopeptidase/acylaminoacyl peptidase
MSIIRSVFRSFVLVTVALFTLACSGDSPLAPPPAVASVDVDVPSTSVIIGETLTLVATPLDAEGAPLPDRPVTFTSNDLRLATVSATGVVQALAEGNVEITATSEAVATTVGLRIEAVPAASIALASVATDLVAGETSLLEAAVLDADDTPLPGRVVTWTSDDASVATVDAEGMVRAVAEGSTTIRARHGQLEATVTFTVRTDWAADMLYEAHDGTSNFPYLFGFDPRVSPVQPERILPFAGANQVAASPDGSRIAFRCDVAICVADRDGTDIDILTLGDLSYEDSPSWSPDGQRIVFRRWAQGGSAEQVEQTDLWVMNADGSGQVNITNDAASQGDPAWSPVRADGGTRIAYRQMAMIDGFVTNRLYTMRPDGSDRRAETAGGLTSATEPSWTPDGAHLVYVQHGGEVTSDVWILTVGAGDGAPLMAAPLPEEQRGPTVSPDGRHVLFTSTHEEVAGVGFKRQLFTVRIDGTDVRRRTSDALDKENAAWRVRP